MNDLSFEKTMTIKEIAEIFNCDEITIRRKVKELFPDLIKNGVTTYLNELQVTAIKINLDKNVELPKTNLEKELIIQQALIFQNEKVNILQKEIEELKPKAISYDTFISSDGLHSIGEVAKMFGTGREKQKETLGGYKHNSESLSVLSIVDKTDESTHDTRKEIAEQD